MFSSLLPRKSRLARVTWLALIFCWMTTAAIAQSEGVRWYLVNEGLNVPGGSLTLGDNPQMVSLKGGWSCTVGETSKMWPLYEARQTTCQKASDSFEFTVQCERSRPRDHTQIRFRNADRNIVDIIEVGCEVITRAP